MLTQLHTLEATLQPQLMTLPDARVVYRQAGNGPPMILIHGWGASSRYWLTTMAHLSDIRKCYAPDLPGFGESQPIAGMASAERMAALVIDFADSLGLERFDLNGHSFGAGVAAYLAARWPHRVNRLVLTCFSVPRNNMERLVLAQTHQQMELSLRLWKPWLNLWQPWLNLWQPWVVLQLNVPPLPRLLASHYFYQTPDDNQLIQEGIIDLLRMDARTALESASSLGDPIIVMALPDVTAPSLLLGARQDMIMPTSGVEVAARMMPNCRLAWIDRCGHVPMVEQPIAYHQALRDFLTRVEVA